MARLEYHTLRSSPFTSTRLKLIAMEFPIVFAIRRDIRFYTKLRITLASITRKCLYGFVDMEKVRYVLQKHFQRSDWNISQPKDEQYSTSYIVQSKEQQ